MRRSGQLQRKTGMPRRSKPLNPGKGLARGGPLPRYTELRSKPKPAVTPAAATPAKTHATPKKRPENYVPMGRGRKVVITRSEDWCEVQRPGVCLNGRGHSCHHRLDQSLDGSGWRPSNLLRTCGDGSRGCHGWITENPKAAHDEGRWALESHEKPELTPVLIVSPLWPRQRRWALLDDQGGAVPTNAPDAPEAAA